MLSWFLLLFCVPNSVNSRPNPQAWCNNNLRKIESAKYQIAAENLLTNGTVIPGGRLSKYLDGGFDSLECVKHGNYTVNAIGIEPRCSVHGSMSEMEAGWKKGIH